MVEANVKKTDKKPIDEWNKLRETYPRNKKFTIG